MLNIVGIPTTNVTLREAKPNDINTTNLWCWCGARISQRTGSTNLSLGGFSGQTERWPLGARPQCSGQFVAY